MTVSRMKVNLLGREWRAEIRSGVGGYWWAIYLEEMESDTGYEATERAALDDLRRFLRGYGGEVVQEVPA